MRDELLSPDGDDEERHVEARDEVGLRPQSLDDFVGQEQLKAHLRVMLQAARGRDQPMGHLLFAGPPGLGKTTLATIIANEMGATIHVTSGPALEKGGDLAAILTKLEDGDVLFIDEIHRLPRPVEEVLYPAMEDFQLDLVLGKGPAARTMRLPVAQFTLIGATTRTGLITGPLRDRFDYPARLDFYEPDELQSIVLRASGILDVTVDGAGAKEIALRSRGTPRIANRLLRQVRDFAEVERDGKITEAIARDGLEFFGVDSRGLDKSTRALLLSLCNMFDGGPVGLKTLSISVSEPVETVEDVYEPYLIQQGFLMRTPKGRVATVAAWQHLGLIPPNSSPDKGTPPGLFD
ncbi:MAG: Holliday junction DNA helicase RuvB [Verrucomicrobiales bacterium]|jgi:Holliday junction DNA helicase RuvB